MTDLSRFTFYLYDSATDQGLYKTLILGVDPDTGQSKISSQLENSTSDYIDIN